MFTRLLKIAATDTKLEGLLIDLSTACHKASDLMVKYTIRENGSGWYNGRAIRVDYSTEELYDNAVAKARKACRIMNILRREYGVKYNRYYDLTKDEEVIKLAALALIELGTACNDVSALDKADDLLAAI